MAKQGPGASAVDRRDARKELAEAISKYRDQRFRSNAALAMAAGTSETSVSTIVRGKRIPSAGLIERLAKVLVPEGESLGAFTEELLRLAGRRKGPVSARYAKRESLADRVTTQHRLRVGLIVSEPFVSSVTPPLGFAVKLVELLATILGVKVVEFSSEEYRFKDFYEVLEDRKPKVDVIVSGVIRTFRRQQRVGFVGPLPFLRVPLSAIVRRDAVRRGELTVQKILHNNGEALRDLNFIVVQGEVGEEFANTFLQKAAARSLRGDDAIDRLGSVALLDAVRKGERERDLIFADMGTCRALCEASDWEFEPVREDENDPTWEVADSLVHGDRRFPVLALFPIGFAVAREDERLRSMLNGALQALLTDGLRPLLALYREYLGVKDSISPFWTDREELLPVPPSVSKAFGKLFEQGRFDEAASRGYRSRGVPQGHFSRLGNLHLHIDGAGRRRFVVQVLRELEEKGLLGKLNEVRAFRSGAQRGRRELTETYQSHTPGGLSAEHLEYFSTSELPGREKAAEIVRDLLLQVGAERDVVIEVERVVARGDEDGWALLPFDDLAPIGALEARYEPGSTLAFELHHGIDILKAVPGQSGMRVVDLDKLAEALERQGIEAGGWFLFEKGQWWAYRSNAFYDAARVNDEAKRQHETLKKHLPSILEELMGKEQRFEFRCRTVVEQVLGVWRTPLYEA